MTRDDITRMASMAGFETKRDMAWVDQWEVTRSLERFAALVRAAEREACAKVCEQLGEDSNYSTGRVWGRGCALAIRARGTTPTFSPATLTSPRGSLGEEV